MVSQRGRGVADERRRAGLDVCDCDRGFVAVCAGDAALRSDSTPDGAMRRVLARVVLPRVAEWHVLLSDMLLPERNLLLHADVLTRTALYQGVVQDKVLGVNGALNSLTLAQPRRFLREEYKEAQAADKHVSAKGYWRDIPGNLFVIVGSEIANVNLRYVSATSGIAAHEPTEQEKAMLRQLLTRLSESL